MQERDGHVNKGAISLADEWELISIWHNQGDDALALNEVESVELISEIVAGSYPKRPRTTRQVPESTSQMESTQAATNNDVCAPSYF